MNDAKIAKLVSTCKQWFVFLLLLSSRLFIAVLPANSFASQSTISSAGRSNKNRIVSISFSSGSTSRCFYQVHLERIEVHADQHGPLLLPETSVVDSARTLFPTSSSSRFFVSKNFFVRSFFKANGSDEEEETPSGPSNALRPSTPQSPHLVNGSSTITSTQRTGKVAIPLVSTSSFCHICKIVDEESDESLMTCTSCQHQFHPLCLDINNDMLAIIKTYSWQCMDCKSCGKCQKAHDEVRREKRTSFRSNERTNLLF